MSDSDRNEETPQVRGLTKLGTFLKAAEPWGVALTVAGLSLALWQTYIDRRDREEDRINRAISQFADGIGRIDALSVLKRNNVDLRFLNAQGAYLPEADLSGLDLTGVDFTGAQLRGANFSNTIIHQTIFDDSDISLANFAQAEISEVSFVGADLTSTTFNDARFETSESLFVGISLRGTSFLDAQSSGFSMNPAYFTIPFDGSPRAKPVDGFCETVMPDGTLCSFCRPDFSTFERRLIFECPYLEDEGIFPDN